MKCTLIFSVLIAFFAISCLNDETDNNLPLQKKRLIAMNMDGNLFIEFKFDDLNRLVELNRYSGDSLIYIENYDYDSNNKIVKRTFDGFVETYEYGEMGKLLSIIKYYAATHKEWRIDYEYDKSLIKRGERYFNGSNSGYVIFKYDSNNNTTERTEFSYYGEENDFMDSQYKFAYDDKINPLKNLSIYPFDVVQINNPVYFYHFEAIMSSLPPEYTITYEYDTDGYPVKEYRGGHTLEYIYN